MCQRSASESPFDITGKSPRHRAQIRIWDTDSGLRPGRSDFDGPRMSRARARKSDKGAAADRWSHLWRGRCRRVAWDQSDDPCVASTRLQDQTGKTARIAQRRLQNGTYRRELLTTCRLDRYQNQAHTPSNLAG